MELDELVDRHYDNLNKTDREIWRFVSTHQNDVVDYTINELAQACFVSRATIMRFTQKLSLSGYAEFKTRLRMQIVKKLLSSSYDLSFFSEVYKSVADDIQAKNLDEAFKHIHEAEHVFVVSSGIIQCRVADELIRLFSLTGDYFINLEGVSEARSKLMKLHKNDVVIMISLSGENAGMLNLTRRMKIKGVYVISFTRMSNNSLAAMTDENVYILTTRLPIADAIGFDYNSITPYYVAVEVFFLKYQMFKKQYLSLEKKDSA